MSCILLSRATATTELLVRMTLSCRPSSALQGPAARAHVASRTINNTLRIRRSYCGGGVFFLRDAAPAVSLPCKYFARAEVTVPGSRRIHISAGEWKRMPKGTKVECSAEGGGHEVASSGSSVLPPVERIPSGLRLRITYCPKCGGITERKIPDGEHELRVVCTVCGAVHYENPKMVVGCLVEYEDQILLCRRSIEPSYGFWTLPAGYMEIGESAAEGAARETMEEACAEVDVLGLFAHLDIPFIGQSYILFRAQLKTPDFAPGPESLECALFKLDDIPFDRLAFSSIGVALKLYVEDVKSGKMCVHHGVIDKRPGAALSDPEGFVIRDHLRS